MKERFDISAGVRGEINNVSDLKGHIDKVDDIIGEFFGFTKDEIIFIKNYDIQYRCFDKYD